MESKNLHFNSRGLGIGTTPSALIAHGINTTIVEIDPVVHKFATQYFDLSPKHISVIEDATIFVSKSEAAAAKRQLYDYIIHDVFTGGAEPTELFTAEFLQGLSNMLATDGVIAIVREKPRGYGQTALTCLELRG